MAEYAVRLKRTINLPEAIIPLRSYYANNIAPLSRGHRLELTEAQAEQVRNLPMVASVEKAFTRVYETKNTTQNGTYTKIRWTDIGYLGGGSVGGGTEISNINVTPSECLNWGLYECTSAPTESWGINRTMDPDNDDYNYWLSGDSVLHSLGEHVDVIISDIPMPYDHPEFIREDGTSRFVQYDWHQLTPYIQNVLGYSDEILTSEYTYANHAAFSDIVNERGKGKGRRSWDHGIHVGTTAAGRRYGWAKEANVYSIGMTFGEYPPGQSSIGFDGVWFYIRAFHLLKPINPVTGRKNPTIVNCSWGLPTNIDPTNSFKDVEYVIKDGVRYDESNPFPNGWDRASLYWETGIDLVRTPQYDPVHIGYHEDCKDEGIVVCAAAGNDGQMLARETSVGHNDMWRNRKSNEDIFMYRNEWAGAIVVGSMGTSRDRARANSSNFGSAVDVFAPGQTILASVLSSQNWDGRWGGPGSPNVTYNDDTNYGTDTSGNNFCLGIKSGTSMASPQVCGIIACHASSLSKSRYTYYDALKYLQDTSRTDRLGFDRNYFYHSGYPVPDGVLNSPSIWHQNNYFYPSPMNFDGINSQGDGWDFEYPPYSIYDQGVTVAEEDIYGNRWEDRGIPFYVYEGQTLEYFDIADPDDLYSSRPYVFKTTNTTGDGDQLSEWGYSVSQSWGEWEISLTLENGYSKAYGLDTIYLQDTTDINVYKEIKILEPPNDFLNYKFNNDTYVDSPDAILRTAFCKTTRPTNGQITQTEGQRTSGCLYPRRTNFVSTSVSSS